jgi:hypothetical protein
MNFDKIINKYKDKCDDIFIEARMFVFYDEETNTLEEYPDVLEILPYIRVGYMVCDEPFHVSNDDSSEKFIDHIICERLEKFKNIKENKNNGKF